MQLNIMPRNATVYVGVGVFSPPPFLLFVPGIGVGFAVECVPAKEIDDSGESKSGDRDEEPVAAHPEYSLGIVAVP